MTWLLIDDIRDGPGDLIVRTSKEAKEILTIRRDFQCVAFDNDLGEGNEEGWKILAWMLEDLNYYPPMIYLVTSNTPARENMSRILKKHGYIGSANGRTFGRDKPG